MNNPFDIIKSFHSKNWDKISDRDKARNLFMINRTCSIAYPLQANSFNNIKINPEKVVDFWKIFVTHKHKNTPSWIWTKTLKKEKAKEKKEYKEEILIFIKEKYEISNREIEDLKRFFPEKFNNFYKDVETLLS
jgi:hypothetical protein